jgi:hypothetical protein
LFPMNSHDVNTMFLSSFHNVPNDFSWYSQYVLQILIVFLNTFPRAPHFYPIWCGKCCHSLFIYIIKEGSLITLWHSDLRSHDVLDCFLGIFRRLLMNKVHWLGFIVFGIIM